MPALLFDVGAKRLRVSFEDAAELIRHLRRSRRRESPAALAKLEDALLERGRASGIIVLNEHEARAVWHVLGRWEDAPEALRALRGALGTHFRLD